ncbi:tetratricopeptide repeat protein [Microcoleus sp. N9_B4]|uniref:tetratricopeptide repeat protein n=1 Tax=Microcoleus sp. N9_B4 TaxID=3055386 RepID=UPI002FD55C55
MFARTQWFLAGMLIALSVQLSQPVAAAVSVGKTVPTAQTNSKEAAHKAFKEGVQLYEQATAESLKGAIIKYEEALKLYRAVGDRRGEANTLHNVGNVYSGLGEKQKALEYYSQSLALRRAVGDRGGESDTLHNIGFVYSDLGEKQKALEYLNQFLSLMRAAVSSPNGTLQYPCLAVAVLSPGS